MIIVHAYFYIHSSQIFRHQCRKARRCEELCFFQRLHTIACSEIESMVSVQRARMHVYFLVMDRAMFLWRLLCCNTDENVHASSDDDSSGDELGAGRRGATAAVIHWPQDPADHANVLSQGAGSIGVLPSSTRHTARARHRKSVAFLPSDPRSKVPRPVGEEEGAKPGALGGVEKNWAASLVSFVCFILET